MSPAAVNFAAVFGLSITYGEVVTMMLEKADDNKAASGRAFNAKVTVQVPAQNTAAPEARGGSDSAIQRDKPQATNRDPASTSNSSS
jgi:hypothetical protein